MITIGVTKKIVSDLKMVQIDNESMNDVLLRLMDMVDEYMDDSYDGYCRTNINVSDEVLDRLKGYRSRKGESYGSVITRMLELYNNLEDGD